jgi:hypothetical protein
VEVCVTFRSEYQATPPSDTFLYSLPSASETSFLLFNHECEGKRCTFERVVTYESAT